MKGVDQKLKVVLEKGPRKVEILKMLENSNEPLGSDMISSKLKIEISNVIRILNELERLGAVRCVTERKRDRRFEITEKGKYHLSRIK